MLSQSDTASRQPTGQQKTLSLDDERDRSGPDDSVTSPEPTVLDDTSPKRSPRDVSANVSSQNETLDLEDTRGSASLDPVPPQLSPSKPIESDPDHGLNRVPNKAPPSWQTPLFRRELSAAMSRRRCRLTRSTWLRPSRIAFQRQTNQSS